MNASASILQCNPGAAYLERKAPIDAAVRRVLESGWYILGGEVRRFEQEFAAYLGAPEAVAVANGTDALELAFRALGVGPGDSVATVSHTAVATVAAIERCGARAVLVDVDPDSCLMSPSALEQALQNPPGDHRIRAVVPVHLYGLPADMASIGSIAARFGVPVVEDCAQSHGARLDGRRTGTFGVLAAFSFYPTKNLGALGDGGMVAASTPELAETLRALRQYGWRERYISSQPGINSRLDEVQAAILRVQLPHLDEDNRRRRQLADRYCELLSPLPVEIPQPAPGAEHVYHQYVVRCGRRESLLAYLHECGIGTAIHYPQPVHRQPAYRGRVGMSGDLPHTERLCGRILSLPMYPQLSVQEVECVAGAIRRWAESAEGREAAL